MRDDLRHHEGLSSREWLFAIAGSALAVGVVFASAAYFDALGIARGDDWSFIRVLQDFVSTGQIQLTGWVQMTFVGQTVLVLPWLLVGEPPSIVMLQSINGALAALSLLLSYRLARFLLPPTWSVLAPMSLAISTVFASLSASVMTDIPALFSILLTLVLGMRWLQSSHWWWLVLAMASGVWAFSIREYGAVALFTVITIALVERKRSRAFVATSSAGGLILAGSLYVWRSGLSGGTASDYQVNSVLDHSLPTTFLVFLAIGLGVFPAAAFISPVRVFRELARSQIGRVGLAGWTLAIGAGLVMIRMEFPLGNYLTVYGAYPGSSLGSTTVQVLSRADIGFLLLVSTYSVWLVPLVLLRWVSGKQGNFSQSFDDKARAVAMLGLFVVGFLTLTLVTAFLLPVTFDRYLVPLIPLIVILVLYAASSSDLMIRFPVSVAAIFVVLVVAAINFRVTLFSDMVDGLRWNVAQQSVASGLPAEAVDAGFDWVGYHYQGSSQWSEPLGGDRWWQAAFPGFDPCIEVVVGPRDDDTFLIVESRDLLLLPSVSVGARAVEGRC